MTRFTDSARSTNVRSGPEINDRARPVPRVRAGGSLVAFAASAVLLVTVQATMWRIIQLRLLTPRHRTTSYTTVTRPDPADTDPGTDVPEGRN